MKPTLKIQGNSPYVNSARPGCRQRAQPHVFARPRIPQAQHGNTTTAALSPVLASADLVLFPKPPSKDAVLMVSKLSK